MRCVITGGTGFLGSRFVEDFLRAPNHEVVILTRGTRTSRRPRLRYVRWDGSFVPDDVGEVDVVLNLAGANIAEKSWTPAYKRQLRESRLLATRACVDFIQRSRTRPKVFLSASAIGYYGGDNNRPCSEDAVAGTDFMGQLCADWEAAADGAGIRTVLLRIPIVLDANDGILPQAALPFKMFVGGVVGSGTQGISWIHIHDLLRLLRWLIETPSTEGPYNLCTPNWVDQRGFSQAIAKALGRPCLFRVPRFALKTALGERSVLLLGGQKVIPKRLQDAEFSFSFPTIGEAIRDLLGGGR